MRLRSGAAALAGGLLYCRARAAARPGPGATGALIELDLSDNLNDRDAGAGDAGELRRSRAQRPGGGGPVSAPAPESGGLTAAGAARLLATRGPCPATGPRVLLSH